MKLYGYFRSSAAYRVRIAVNMKGIPIEHAFIHLRHGEQLGEPYRALTPHKLVPLLEDNGRLLTQSLAIIEYLEDRYPEPPLLPADPFARAWVRSIALSIACDIHPLNNLRVLKHLQDAFLIDEDGRRAWYRHWIASGLAPLEAMLASRPEPGPFCWGSSPTLADICLVPQIYNAERVACPLDDYPVIRSIVAQCRALGAFHNADPALQQSYA